MYCMKSYIFLLITIILFSTMEIASKTIASIIDPFLLTFYRFSLGALFLLPFFISNPLNRERLKTLKPRIFFQIVFLGFINTFLSMSLLQVSVHSGSASISAILISSNSLFVYIITRIREKSGFKFSLMLKIILGMVGISGVLLFSYMNRVSFSAVSFLTAASASVLFALYTVNGRELVSKFGNMFVTFLSFLFGSLFYIPVIFLFERPYMLSFELKPLLTVLYMGFVVTGIGYACFFEALKGIKPEYGSMVFFLKPAIAVSLSQLVLHEPFNIYQLISMFLILYAVFPEKLLSIFRRGSVENS